LHAKDSDLARYRGVYDAGWDAVRDARVRRQVEEGLFAEAPTLAPHSPNVPAWEGVDPSNRDLMARYMELYAAVVDNMDQNVGRLLDTLKMLGRLDNTLVVITSDNGSNGIGGPEGAANNLAKRLTNSEDAASVRRCFDAGELGERRDGIHAARAEQKEAGAVLLAELEQVHRATQVVLDELPRARASVHAGEHAGIGRRIDDPVDRRQRLQITGRTQVAVKQSHALAFEIGAIGFASRANEIVEAQNLMASARIQNRACERAAHEPADARD
jgi:hypothetical protein